MLQQGSKFLPVDTLSTLGWVEIIDHAFNYDLYDTHSRET